MPAVTDTTLSRRLYHGSALPKVNEFDPEPPLSIEALNEIVSRNTGFHTFNMLIIVCYVISSIKETERLQPKGNSSQCVQQPTPARLEHVMTETFDRFLTWAVSQTKVLHKYTHARAFSCRLLQLVEL